MPIDKYEVCENCTLLDYVSILFFILFPPAGLYLLLIRRNKWKLYGVAWQEYFFLIATIIAWIVVFAFNKNFISGVFIANVALFFAISTSSFLGVFLPASEYLARFLVAALSSIVSLELAISTALNWDKTLSHNPCSTEMQHIGLIGIMLLIVIFFALPTVSRKPALLADLISNKTPVTIDWVCSSYTFLLLSALALPFVFKRFPNFILILSCS